MYNIKLETEKEKKAKKKKKPKENEDFELVGKINDNYFFVFIITQINYKT